LLFQLDDFLVTLDRQSGKIQKYLTLSESDRTTLLIQFDTINRSCFLTKCMFDVEHLIKSMLDILSLPTKKGYYSITEDLLKVLNLYDVQKHKILTLPAQVRNSLHNNGYTDFDIDVSLRGRLFQAKKSQQVTFSGWDNLYIMLDEMTDLLIDIVDNSKINKQAFIPLK